MAAEPVPVGDMADSDGGGADTDVCSDIDVANMHDEDFLDEGEVGDMVEVVGAEDTKAFVVAGNVPASSSAAVPASPALSNISTASSLDKLSFLRMTFWINRIIHVR